MFVLLVFLLYSITTLFGSFNAKSNFKKIQFRISTQFTSENSSISSKSFFCMNAQLNSIWPIERTVPCDTNLSPSAPGNNGNDRSFCILRISSITGTSPSDCLESYLGHSFGGGYPSVEEQSVYFAALADWTTINRRIRILLYIYIYIYI